jgi:eukaryotic-like serine/threonine-protein kinase
MSPDHLKDDNLVGRVLLHYQIVGRLGEGGMGVVYRAEDLRLHRTVALKFVPASQAVSREVKQRFMREAMASSALDHPNIGTLYAVEETGDGQLFLVMAFYDGPTLANKMERGPMPADEAIAIALQICRGLQAAHQRGVVHRDIKPQNLIFNSQGALKILDFGLAKLHGSPELTMPGSTMGTAAYMAPEQAMGQAADGRADLWSVGVVLYEMLSGRPLFRAEDLRSTIVRVISRRPEPIANLRPSLENVLNRALEKEPERRYQNAGEMIADLETARVSHLSSDSIAVTQAPIALTSEVQPAAIRKPVIPLLTMAAGIAVLLVAAIIVGWLGWRARRHSSQSSSSGERIVSLPLVAIGAEGSANPALTQALADGLRSRLIDSLSSRERGNPGLVVIPVAQIASQHVTDPAGARRALGAEFAITGSLTATGDRLRVVLSSVNTATSKVLQSETIEGSRNGLPELSQKIADTAAAMLGLKAVPSLPVSDPVAHLPPAEANTYLASLGFLQHWDKTASLDAAIAGFEQVVKASPDFALGYASLADAYQRRYMTTKDTHALELADRNASRAAQLEGDLPAVELSLGEVRLIEGKFPEAVATFERVLAVDDRNDRAYRGLAKAYAAMGLPDKAEQTWQKAVALRPNSADAHNQLALFELSRGNYTQASAEFRRALNLAPENVTLMSNLGVALLYAGSLDESRRVLQQSIRLEPTYAAFTNLGNLDLKQDRFEDAASDYEKALEINKTDYRVWSNLAVAYSRSPGQKERAQDGFLQAAKLCREALKGNPNDPETISDLAMFVASEGDERQEPLVLIEGALALAPQDTYVQFNAAETYESLGYRKEALDWIAKLVAAGYPLDDINESPVLADLVQDKRYAAIVQSRKK